MTASHRPNDQSRSSVLCPPGLAVIGSGYWGRNLVRNYNDLGVLKLVCDKNETLLAQFKEQYPNVDTCLAINEVISREDIQAVVIATPAETHFVLAREVLLAGKHVFVEKPLVLYENEAEELIKLSEERKVVLMVGHLLQYHPVFVRLRELAAKGELGRINYVYSHRLNLGKIRREESILWSFAPHDISMILSIAGEEPESVLATGGNYLHQRIADVTTTHLEFPSGLKAHVFVSWLHPFKDQKLVVVGDRKMAVFDDTKPWPDKLLLYAHEIRWEKNMPVPAKAEPERLNITQAEPLRLECEHFLDCISSGRHPQTDGHEGLAVLKILNASQSSLNTHGTKVFVGVKPGSNEAYADKESTHPGRAHEQTTHVQPHSDDKARPPAREEDAVSATPYFVHATSLIDDRVVIGAGTKIWHFSHVMSDCVIGERCSVGQNVVIGPAVGIGNGCKIQNNVSVYKGVILEDDVFCGPSMVFTNVYNPRAHIKRMDELRVTLVKKGASLGANCTIICGNTVGRYAFVGAGSVVTKAVPDHALVVGNPAKQIGWVCECGTKVDENFVCPACKRKLVLSGK